MCADVFYSGNIKTDFFVSLFYRRVGRMATLIPFWRDRGGKSEHRRIGCPVTRGIREDMESAAETRPPSRSDGRVRVKRRCKRPPVPPATAEACKPHPVQDQIGSDGFGPDVIRVVLPLEGEERVGCLISVARPGPDEWPSSRRHSGNRTRLIDRLSISISNFQHTLGLGSPCA